MSKAKTTINLTETEVSEKKYNFKVQQEILALTPRKNGNTVRIDLASWNDGAPKVELRLWATKEGEFKPTKGFGISVAEFKELVAKLSEMEVK